MPRHLVKSSGNMHWALVCQCFQVTITEVVVKRDKEQEKRNNKCISEVLSTKYRWDNSQTPYQKYPRDNGERHTRGKKNQVSIIIFYFLNKSLGRIPWLECISTKYTKMRKCRSSFNPKEHAKLLNTTTQGLSRRWWNYTIPWHIASNLWFWILTKMHTRIKSLQDLP